MGHNEINKKRMEKKVENLIVDWLKSDNENATQIAYEICNLFAIFLGNNEVLVCAHEFIPKKCWVHKCFKCGELRVEYKEAN